MAVATFAESVMPHSVSSVNMANTPMVTGINGMSTMV